MSEQRIATVATWTSLGSRYLAFNFRVSLMIASYLRQTHIDENDVGRLSLSVTSWFSRDVCASGHFMSRAGGRVPNSSHDSKAHVIGHLCRPPAS